jgi:hypothetical protein
MLFDGIYSGMALVKATFFLPLKDNDGRDLSQEISEVEDECFLAFGAWILTGHFRGVWRMETGERQIDTSAAYMVILPEDRTKELEDILRRFKANTVQEAIYLELEHDVDLRLI